VEAQLLTQARGGKEEGRARGLDVARGQAGGGGEAGEERRDRVTMTFGYRANYRAIQWSRKKRVMICGTTGCCDTSVRRHERDYEAASLSRDEFPGANRAARGG
jgi:hypothetical protein